jgi:hypothetical protein
MSDDSNLTETWPPTFKGAAFKGGEVATKKAKQKVRRGRLKGERDNKALVRRRDRMHCRWPLCGCGKLGLALEVSHDTHKGIGGDPTGKRSQTELMILFCRRRHREAIFSRHAGNLRTRYLTEFRNNGPVAFEAKRVDLVKHGLLDECFDNSQEWIELARERSIQDLEPVVAWARVILRSMAEMTL